MLFSSKLCRANSRMIWQRPAHPLTSVPSQTGEKITVSPNFRSSSFPCLSNCLGQCGSLEFKRRNRSCLTMFLAVGQSWRHWMQVFQGCSCVDHCCKSEFAWSTTPAAGTVPQLCGTLTIGPPPRGACFLALDSCCCSFFRGMHIQRSCRCS